jgi:hypothetical protein
MLSWFLNPWMLLGGLAIASPILIHLLNKRRFKIVEWAAMDFLFQADKKNRRRVQLENIILLMLRCLAMLLVALLFARPFLPSELTAAFQQTQKFERVILIDDSLSQRTLTDTQPAIEIAKQSVTELLSQLANSEKSEDWLTVMLTSQPDQPILSNEPLTPGTLPTLTQTIEDIECADQAADYRVSLAELKRYVSGTNEDASFVTYFYSDMRQRDWSDEAVADSDSAPNQLFNDVAENTVGCFLIDVGSPLDDNLAIVSVRPETLQVADKSIRYIVQVANYGSQTINDVRVLLQIDEGQPSYETLQSIAPGKIAEVSFRHVFPNRSEADFLADDETAIPKFRNYRIRAEIDRQSLGEAGLPNDQLTEDSSALFGSRVMDGVSVLLVDGDPSASSERSETHYLRSLDVLGTGLDAESVTVNELETVSLSQYEVIFLCNVDEASPDRVESLKQWVREGGSLVFMPGNRVRAATFNETFFEDGSGLSPLSLTTIAGDPTMSQWVNFEIDGQTHPALQVIVDSDVSSLSNVDVFSWWKSELDAELVGKSVVVPLRLSDPDKSPAMVERSWGDGEVVVFTIPGDGDWTMWPSSPTYAPIMIDLIDYLVGSQLDESSLVVGGSISYPVDLSIYNSRVSLRNPKNEKVEAVAKPVAKSKNNDAKKTDEAEPGSDSGESESPELDSPAESNNSGSGILYNVQFDSVDQRGFYTLELTRNTGEKEPVLFASNYDAQESQLKRLPAATLDANFFDDSISLVSTEQLGSQTVSGGNSEIWMQILMILFGILVTEQFLGWWWGRKR